jgi:N-succinyldiaminopimelate aminotransferase
MNPNLNRLQPYPFQKLAKLLDGITPKSDLTPINLSIGEPKHATPQFIQKALAENLEGLANYPVTQGSLGLRDAIATWLKHRFNLHQIHCLNRWWYAPIRFTRFMKERLCLRVQCHTS